MPAVVSDQSDMSDLLKIKSLHQRLSDLLGSTTVSADRYRRRSRRYTYSPPPPELLHLIKVLPVDQIRQAQPPCSSHLHLHMIRVTH